jgi:hypothetical protein
MAYKADEENRMGIVTKTKNLHLRFNFIYS